MGTVQPTEAIVYMPSIAPLSYRFVVVEMNKQLLAFKSFQHVDTSNEGQAGSSILWVLCNQASK
jgi:hypothetical protein